MMGANYRRGNQGKKKNQIEYSEMAVGVCTIGIVAIILYYSLYHIVSRFVHYIMG